MLKNYLPTVNNYRNKSHERACDTRNTVLSDLCHIFRMPIEVYNPHTAECQVVSRLACARSVY